VPVRVLVFFTLSLLVHWLFARWAITVFPAARRRPRLVLGAAVALSVAVAGLRIVARVSDSHALRAIMAISTIELAIVLFALVPIGVVTLLSRLAVRAARPQDEERRAALVSRREALERIAGVASVGAATAVLGWGAARGRHAFQIEEVVVRVPGWPKALDGYVVAQVSDVHVGVFIGDRELDEGFELVRQVRPDLVVATGDLVDFEARVVPALAARLRDVGARDGAFAIVGNHDHYAGAGEVVRLLRAAGVGVLNNEGVHLRAGDGGGFALLGVDDLMGRGRPQPGHGGPDLSRAIAGLRPDLPRVLLAHQPDYFREAAGRVALQLSGHTHGGQINPGVRPADLFMEFVHGRYERQGSTLWVNRGFGTAGPPSRVGAPPEITKVVLVSA
jgi:uncharacterized protein